MKRQEKPLIQIQYLSTSALFPRLAEHVPPAEGSGLLFILGLPAGLASHSHLIAIPVVLPLTKAEDRPLGPRAPGPQAAVSLQGQQGRWMVKEERGKESPPRQSRKAMNQMQI